MDPKKAEWRPVAGYEDRYEVSNDGRVKAVFEHPLWWLRQRMPVGRILRPGKHRDGHLLVSLSRDGITKGRYVHALVLQAFVGPAPTQQECRHRDGDPTNNSIDNLEWGTRKANASDRRRHGRDTVGERNGSAKLTATAVREIRELRGTATQKVLAERYGVSQGMVSKIHRGENWSI